MPEHRHLPYVLIVLLIGASSTDANAQTPQQGSSSRGTEMRTVLARPESGRQRSQDSMTASVRRIERNTGGRVLSIEQMHSDGRDLNRVKVMDDSGRVRIYVDDPGRRERATRARGDDD